MPKKTSFSRFWNHKAGPAPGLLGPWDGSIAGLRLRLKRRNISGYALAPAWKRGFSLTAEQLEASRAERMRLNGHGVLTLEDARTWIEETGLCLFLPRRQFSLGVAPSFVEAIAGERNANPGAKQVALAEELLV